MEKLNKVDSRKFYEYKEILDVLRETVSENDPAEIILNNPTLRTKAGYTEYSNEENFNPYVKRYLDKRVYDEHNKKVEEAKIKNDNKRLQELSNEAMDKAGYIQGSPIAESGRVNEYFKSYVDRTLLDKKLTKLYRAIKEDKEEIVEKVYRDIYSMTSYSDKNPYGVVNEYAQNFVDSRIDLYIEKGIHEPPMNERYAL